MVLNVDGNSIGNPGPTGYGGLICSGEGKWQGGFYGSIGISDNLRAELAALYFGLTFAWDSGMRRLVCYSDSAMAIELVRAPVAVLHREAALIANVQALLAKEWEVELLHTLREGNGSADVLANLGATKQEQFTVVTLPPLELGQWLPSDAMRIFI